MCVCMPALVVAVLIAYDYECARKLSASLFLGSQKQAFLASWLWALIVYIYIYIHTFTMTITMVLMTMIGTKAIKKISITVLL